MAARRIVETVDVALYSIVRFSARRKDHMVQAFFLQARKERLGHRIVVTVACAAHALRNLPVCEQLAVLVGGILAATIAMVDEPWRWTASSESALQSAQWQLGVEAIAHRPADDAARIEIEHDSQVGPAFGGPDVRDVADPDAVWRIYGEVLPEQVWCEAQRVIGVRGFVKGSRVHGTNSMLAHEPANQFAADVLASIQQVRGACVERRMRPRKLREWIESTQEAVRVETSAAARAESDDRSSRNARRRVVGTCAGSSGQPPPPG